MNMYRIEIHEVNHLKNKITDETVMASKSIRSVVAELKKMSNDKTLYYVKDEYTPDMWNVYSEKAKDTDYKRYTYYAVSRYN